MNKLKLFAVLAFVVAAVVAGISFAQTTGTVGVGVEAVGVEGAFAHITTTTPITDTYATGAAAPTWSPSVGAAGDITGGDIYYQ